MSVEKALSELNSKLSEKELRLPVSFDDFLDYAQRSPNNVLRNIFQLFSDMIDFYIGKGEDDNPEDPEFVNFVKYDCSRLFVEGTDTPFLADRPFANRLVNLARSFRTGAQRNKIYIFEGPTGSGKSTFLNNLLKKFEEYTDRPEGFTYEIVWRIDKERIGGFGNWQDVFDRYQDLRGHHSGEGEGSVVEEIQQFLTSMEPLEVGCPSHDNPILIIPKAYRRNFLDHLITDEAFKERLFNRKEYEWVFKEDLCTICSSLYHTLLDKLESPSELFRMIYARKYQFNRRLGEGISVFNPGDSLKKEPIHNPVIQKILNNLLKNSNAVYYLHSSLARTNNGIFAIMDVKSHNKDRIMNLHGIISDSVHKVEHIEEHINSLFIALMNPEDKDVVESVKSLGDRIMRIPIPYVLDYRTEVEIYHNKFGREVDNRFLPRVLENFARVVISSRINTSSGTLKEWIKDPKVYEQYCDKDLLLLKMELYSGHIPTWLSEEDRKSFDARRRRSIIAESEKDGLDEGCISGRKSIEIFNEFFSKYAKEGSLIDMGRVHRFFHERKDQFRTIPEDFLDSLVRLYDFNILQEVKESLYSYNEKEIAKDGMKYLFAVNFEPGSHLKSVYTGMDLEVTEEFFRKIEERLIRDTSREDPLQFRQYVQKEYASKTLTYEMGVEKKHIRNTALFRLLLEKYQYNLKETVLNPLIDNDNFRSAIKDYGTPSFNSYDKNITRDVQLLMKNLKKNYQYTDEGAKQVCIYIIDNRILEKFGRNAAG